MVSPLQISNALKFLRSGGIVAVPTDTVYGFAVDAENESAVKKLYNIKRRPVDKPIPLMIKDKLVLYEIAFFVPEAAITLIDRYWPGALTVVLRKSDSFTSLATGGTDTIGVRIPDNDFMLKLLKEFERPLAVTSANISGEKPCTNHREVKDKFNGMIDYIVPGEAKHKNISTVADFTKDPPELIRGGMIKLELKNL